NVITPTCIERLHLPRSAGVLFSDYMQREYSRDHGGESEHPPRMHAKMHQPATDAASKGHESADQVFNEFADRRALGFFFAIYFMSHAALPLRSRARTRQCCCGLWMN